MRKNLLFAICGTAIVVTALFYFKSTSDVSESTTFEIVPMQPIKEDTEPKSKTGIEFSNIRTARLTDSSITITSNTNIPVICEIEYGTDGKFTRIATETVMQSDMPHVMHEVTIDDLQSDTKYNYRLVATSADEKFRSEVFTFKTK